jgi:hypothetical protein
VAIVVKVTKYANQCFVYLNIELRQKTIIVENAPHIAINSIDLPIVTVPPIVTDISTIEKKNHDADKIIIQQLCTTVPNHFGLVSPLAEIPLSQVLFMYF